MCFKYFFLAKFFEAKRGDCRLTLEKKGCFVLLLEEKD